MVKRAPCPGPALYAVRLPWCASVVVRAIVSRIPDPELFGAFSNLSKNLFGIAYEAVLGQLVPDYAYEAGLVIDDQRAQLPRRTHDQASSFAMNVPCQVWYQTAPVVAFTDSIPTVLPPETVSIV
jgi:hypothetical protein